MDRYEPIGFVNQVLTQLKVVCDLQEEGVSSVILCKCDATSWFNETDSVDPDSLNNGIDLMPPLLPFALL